MKILHLLFINVLLLGGTTLSYATITNEVDFSCSQSMEVLKRDRVQGHVFISESLEHFSCTDGVSTEFNGKYFKIVHTKNKTAISFNDDPKLVKKAANVYYHLEVARKYWTTNIKAKSVINMKQMVIRIDIKNLYSKDAHFKSLNKGENTNNAWTIPAGKTPDILPPELQDKWGVEVWFAPRKVIPTSDLVQSKGDNPASLVLRGLRKPIMNEAVRDLERSIIRQAIEGENLINSATIQDLVVRNLMLHTLYSGILFFTDKMDLWFIQKNFYIDTAMIPDIIYHEFSHVALSDKLPLNTGTPVIEGMADYFATRIAKAEGKVFRGIFGYSNNESKDPNNKTFYDPIYEERSLSDKDFVLSLLWTVRKDLVIANEKRISRGYQRELVNPDLLVYKSCDYLNANSDINVELGRALVRSCRKHCDNKMSGISIIQKSLEDKGL